jgi:methylmalonyl-CoA decarboxylase subunit alpha
MCGLERLSKQRGKGELDARAGVAHLLDSATFREFDTFVGGDIAVDGLVSARGRIDGRPVVLGAQECTPVTGSIGAGANPRHYRLAELVLHGAISDVD